MDSVQFCDYNDEQLELVDSSCNQYWLHWWH